MPEAGRSARSDVVGGACWIAFGVAIVVGAWNMDRFEKVGASLYTVPGLVPGLLGVLLVLLGASLALRGLRRGARGVDGGNPPRVVNARVALMLGLSLAYAAGLVGRVPFWLATVAFLAVFAALFAPPGLSPARRIGVALVVALATTAAVIVVFEQIFLVRLP